MTEEEVKEDPGWAKIQEIKQKGQKYGTRELPCWDIQKKDYMRAWTAEDFDMTKQYFMALEAELIDHDQIKSQVRRGRNWPATEWDDRCYLDQHWPDKDRWLTMIRIWKRALWSRFLGVISFELKDFNVGVTVRAPYKTRRCPDPPNSSGVDQDIVAWVIETALVDAAHGHDLLKEGILWTSCKIHKVDLDSDGKTARIDAMVSIVYPYFLTHLAVGPWDLWLKGALRELDDPRVWIPGGHYYTDPMKYSSALKEDFLRKYMRDLFRTVQEVREARKWKKTYGLYWPQWSLIQKLWGKELAADLKEAPQRETAKREAGLFHAWLWDPPVDERLEESRQTRIKDIDNLVRQLSQEIESTRLQFADAGIGDPDTCDLYMLELKRIWGWVTTLQSLKVTAIEEKPRWEYPDLMEVVIKDRKQEDRLIYARQEELRQKINLRKEQAQREAEMGNQIMG